MGFILLLSSKECLPGLLENSCVSQIRHWNVLVALVINKSKASGHFQLVFFILATARGDMVLHKVQDLGDHMLYLFAAKGKKVRLLLKVKLKWV